MTTVKELKEQCKKKGIKGYSKLNKKGLEQLLKKNHSPKNSEAVKKPDVKKPRCPKGSRRNPKSGECEKTEKKGKEQKKSKFNKEAKILAMKKETKQHVDPIWMEEFQDWEDDELQNAILLHNYYYKPSTLLGHVQAKLKAKQVVKDPMNNVPLTQEEILRIYKANKKQYKPIESFVFDTTNMNLQVRTITYRHWPFQEITLTYNPNIYSIKVPKIYKKNDNTIIIGIIPNGISALPGHGEVMALDAASTSEAIFIKVWNLVRDGKLFRINKKNKTKITYTPLKNLPISLNKLHSWMKKNKPDTGSHSCYIKLINELNNID